MTTYEGWWEVPPHLMSATALKELEFPRVATGDPVAWVRARDWRGKADEVALYDVRVCPPTPATAAQLEAAGRRADAGRRVCEDCGALCQRPVPPRDDAGSRRLCPACRHILVLRVRQRVAAANRDRQARWAADVLAAGDAVIVQVDLTVPPPAESGRKRPATAARIRAVDLAGQQLLETTLRLVGPRSRWVPPDAVPREEGAVAVHTALAGQPLILWDFDEAEALRAAAPHPDWRYGTVTAFDHPPRPGEWTTARHRATEWRGQVDPKRLGLVDSVPPGTPDRLALMVRRMAETAVTTNDQLVGS